MLNIKVKQKSSSSMHLVLIALNNTRFILWKPKCNVGFCHRYLQLLTNLKPRWKIYSNKSGFGSDN